jgi:hypothetical protein
MMRALAKAFLRRIFLRARQSSKLILFRASGSSLEDDNLEKGRRQRGIKR